MVIAGLISWLNRNTGAVQSVTAVLLLAVTTAYVVLTWRLLHETRRTRRAYVYFEMHSKGAGILNLSLTNGGERAATNIRTVFTSDVADRDGKLLAPKAPFAAPVEYLPPGRHLTMWHLVPLTDTEANPGERVIAGTVTYCCDGKEYSDPFHVDLGAMRELLLEAFGRPLDPLADAVKKLHGEVAGVKKVLDKR